VRGEALESDLARAELLLRNADDEQVPEPA
jgi:hypothetical protein